MSRAGCGRAFDFVLVPCAEQPEEFECGYLAILWLITTLRGLVGVDPGFLRGSPTALGMMRTGLGVYQTAHRGSYDLLIIRD